MKEELINLRSNLKEKYFYLKNKLRNLEDRSRRSTICVEGIQGSENEGWNVAEEKLRKVIKDELDIENVVIEGAHSVKQNIDSNENNAEGRKPTTVIAKLLHFKDKQKIWHDGKSRKIRNFHSKEEFFKRNFRNKKGLWNEVVRLREKEGKVAVINYDRIHSVKFSAKKIRITGSFQMNKN